MNNRTRNEETKCSGSDPPLGTANWRLLLDDTQSQQDPPASLQEIPHRSAQVHKRSPTNPSKPTSMDELSC